MKKETSPILRSKTRSSLLRAAGKIFARKGFEGTSIREICTAAKTNISAVNYYFGDKVGLYRAVIEHGIDLANELYPLPQKRNEEDYQSFLCRQIAVVQQRIKETSGSKWYQRIVQQELLLPKKEIREIIDKKCIENDYNMFYKTLRLIEPRAPDQAVKECTIYLTAILGFHIILLPHLSGIISSLDKKNITEIGSSSKSIATFIVAGLKASVVRESL